jgi:hypothetical protein
MSAQELEKILQNAVKDLGGYEAATKKVCRAAANAAFPCSRKRRLQLEFKYKPAHKNAGFTPEEDKQLVRWRAAPVCPAAALSARP